MLERIGISLEEDLLAQFDRLIAEKGYVNRSEAVRDLIRDSLVQREWASRDKEEKVAVVTLVYDHDSASLVHPRPDPHAATRTPARHRGSRPRLRLRHP